MITDQPVASLPPPKDPQSPWPVCLVCTKKDMHTPTGWVLQQGRSCPLEPRDVPALCHCDRCRRSSLKKHPCEGANAKWGALPASPIVRRIPALMAAERLAAEGAGSRNVRRLRTPQLKCACRQNPPVETALAHQGCSGSHGR